MNLFDMYKDAQLDDLELGMRIACCFIAENETDPDNFIRILKFKHQYHKGGI